MNSYVKVKRRQSIGMIVIAIIMLLTLGLALAEPRQEGYSKTTAWNISAPDRDLVIKTVVGTAGNSAGQVEQMAVVACIYNQQQLSGKPISSIVKQGFALSDETPTKDTLEAVDAAVGGLIIDTRILYCKGSKNATVSSMGWEYVTKYGDLLFYN